MSRKVMIVRRRGVHKVNRETLLRKHMLRTVMLNYHRLATAGFSVYYEGKVLTTTRKGPR